jgi:hypothetical protein
MHGEARGEARLPAVKEFQRMAMEEGTHRFNRGLEKKQRRRELQPVGKMGMRRGAWSI